jgi:hypothetical protein
MRRILHFLAFLTLALVAAAQPFRPWLNPGISDPRNLNSLAAWYDASATSSMLSVSGATITDGGAVALWADKSGNSGVNALVNDGASANGATVLDAAWFPTGEIEVEVDVSVNDVTPSAITALVGKYAGAGARSLAFGINTSGTLRFEISEDGTNATAVSSSIAVGHFDYSRWSAKATWRPSDGRVQFFTKPFGGSYTQLGIDRTIAYAAIFDSATVVTIGQLNNASGSGLIGKLYRATIKDGIDGTTVLDIDFTTAPKKLANGDTFVCTTGQTVTLNSSGATGARIAGERDLYQGTAANRPVLLKYSGTKYGYLNGTAGNYFSTPDSAAVSIGQQFALAIDLSRRDWTPAATQIFLAKRTAGQYTLLFYLRTDGKIDLGISTNGNTTAVLFTSSAAVPDVANARYFIGAEVDLNNGSGSSASFYTSNDSGATWSELGATQTNVGTFTPFDGTAPLEAGSQQAGTVALAECNIYRAFVTAGTLADAKTADFNPALYTSGTTFTASTGEVWTVNGGAHIVTRTGLYFDGSNDYLKTAAFSLSQPATYYLAFDPLTFTNTDTILAGSSATNRNLFYQGGTTPATVLYSGASVSGSNTGFVLKTGTIATIGFNGASSFSRVKRAAPVAANPGTENANGVTIGALDDGTLPSNVFVSELAAYSAAHPTATQDSVALYEIIKWDIVE